MYNFTEAAKKFHPKGKRNSYVNEFKSIINKATKSIEVIQLDCYQNDNKK